MSKILLIEDNEMNPDMLSRRLEHQGFNVVMAFEAGFHADDTKPIDFKRLLGKTDNFLSASWSPHCIYNSEG